MHGVYVGPDQDLKGETALLQLKISEAENRVWLLAQFDNHRTGLGYGWHPYPINQFHVWRPE